MLLEQEPRASYYLGEATLGLPADFLPVFIGGGLGELNVDVWEFNPGLPARIKGFEDALLGRKIS